MSQIVIYDNSPVPGSDVEGLLPDSGTSPVLPNGSGYISVIGGQLLPEGETNITTVGSLNTLSVSLKDDITLTNNAASSTPSELGFRKLRTGRVITSGDGLGNLFYYGNDGSSNILSAAMSVISSGTIGSARIPSQFEWYTTPDAIGPSLTLRMGIPADGGLVIQNPTTGLGLSVQGGGANITGSFTLASLSAGALVTNSSGVVSAANDTAGYVLTSNGAGSAPTFQAAASANLTITNIDNTDSPYTVLSTDQYISCDVSTDVITVQLPNSTTDGRVIRIKDYTGDASTNNITVTTVGGTVLIDGATSYVMNSDFQAINIVWNNTNTAYEIF